MNPHFSIVWATRQIKNPQLSLYIVSAVKQLKGMGIKAGDRVAICAENSVEYIILLLALWHIKALAATISPRWPDKTISAYAAKINAPHVFRSGDIKHIICFDARQQMEAKEEFKDFDVDQEVTIIATSGTSGEAKAAVHTWGNHFYSAQGSNSIIPLTNADRWLLSLPLYHISGIAILVRCLMAGAGLVVMTDGDLTTALRRAQVTHVSLVATQLQRLLEDKDNHSLLQSLKVILLGGSAVPRTLVEQSLALGLNIYLSYGLTEMSSQVATGKVVDAHKPSVKALPYRQLCISSEGEILVRGEVLFKGYVSGTKLHLPVIEGPMKHSYSTCHSRESGSSNRTLAGARNPKENIQWFPSGDIGYLDNEGFLTVTGRRDSMFISGGENIHPEEIEKALLSIPGVKEVIVVPKEDKEFGQRPIAFIQFTGEPLKEEYLITCLQAVLPRFKIPIAFFPWPENLISQGIKISRQEFLKKLPRR